MEVYHVVQRIQSPKIAFKIFTSAFGRVIFAFIFVLGASVWMSNYVSLLVCVLQVVSLLLDRGFVDLGAKNLEGHTVFDILERQTQAKVDNQRISDMLMRRKRPSRCLAALGNCCLICLGVLGAPVILPLIALQRLLRGNLNQILVKCSLKIRRRQTVIKEERRNALLVVAALLITVTYQAALSPDKQPNEFNCTTPINATGANQYFNFTAQNPINATGADRYFNCTARFNAGSSEVNPGTTGAVDVFLWCNTLNLFPNKLYTFLPPPSWFSWTRALLPPCNPLSWLLHFNSGIKCSFSSLRSWSSVVSAPLFSSFANSCFYVEARTFFCRYIVKVFVTALTYRMGGGHDAC